MARVPNLTASQRKRVALADRLSATGKAAEATRSRSLLRQVESEASAAVEGAALKARLVETVRLERARGEEVEVSAEPAHRGRIRVLTRDGLQALRTTGRLGDREYAAGMIYRRAFEAVHRGEIRSHLNGMGQAGGSGPSPERLTLRAHNDAKRVGMEAMAQSERELQALRLVAGEGRCISHFARSGSAQASYAQALGQVLRRLASRFVP